MSSQPAGTENTVGPTRWWVGTYPEAGAGTPAGVGEGIWRVDVDPWGGRVTASWLVAATPAPSFLATHPAGRVIYACGETGEGTVTAFAVTPDGGLAPGPMVRSGGGDPCHLVLGPDARTLYVANYATGTVGVLPLDADGHFTSAVTSTGGPVQVVAHAGSGPDAARQRGSHPHHLSVTPDGRVLLVTDLGTDELRRHAIGPRGHLTDGGTAARLPAGTGPRHLAARPSRDGHLLYLVGELSGTVDVLRWDAATRTARPVQRVVAARSRTTEASDGTPGAGLLPSHLVLHGDRLVVAVRQPGVLAVRLVDRTTGLLGDVDEVPTGGAWPRHLAVAGDVALVANQGSGDLGIVRLPDDGTPAVIGTSPLPVAACIVPVVAVSQRRSRDPSD